VETLVAAILAFLIFGDTLDGAQVLGGAMIVMGIVILARKRSAT